MSNAMSDIHFTPSVIRRIQKDRLKELEAQINKLERQIHDLVQEHSEHARMIQAIENMDTTVSPGKDLDF